MVSISPTIGVRLEPGIVYTWSVSAILDPNARSRDIVASATLLLGAPDPGVENAARTALPARRAVLYAQAGFWYDAVAAAVAAEPVDARRARRADERSRARRTRFRRAGGRHRERQMTGPAQLCQKKVVVRRK